MGRNHRVKFKNDAYVIFVSQLNVYDIHACAVDDWSVPSSGANDGCHWNSTDMQNLIR